MHSVPKIWPNSYCFHMLQGNGICNPLIWEGGGERGKQSVLLGIHK